MEVFIHLSSKLIVGRVPGTASCRLGYGRFRKLGGTFEGYMGYGVYKGSGLGFPKTRCIFWGVPILTNHEREETEREIYVYI